MNGQQKRYLLILKQDLWNRLEELAKIEETEVSKLIRQAIREFLDSRDKLGKEEK